MIQHGKGSVSISTTRRRDPAFGDQLVTTYRGTPSQLTLIELQQAALGFRTEYRDNNGITELAVIGGSVAQGQEQFVDRWSIDTVTVDVSIWASPELEGLLEKKLSVPYPGTLTPIVTVSFRNYLQRALEAGWTIAELATFTGIPDATRDAVYNRLLQGEETYPERRPVLTRIRSYSIERPNSRVVIAGFKTPVYTTSALISGFGVPSVVQAQLPSDPSKTPDDKTWGWKLSQDVLDIDRARYVYEEQKVWEFGAWPTFFYDIDP